MLFVHQPILKIIFAVIVTVSTWKIFVEAGEDGIDSLIPFYNIYTMCKIGRCKRRFIFFLISYIVCMIGYLVYRAAESKMVVDETAANVAFWVGGGIFSVSAILTVVFYILILKRLCNAFDRSGWFAVGMCFFSAVFFPILAFVNVEYIWGELTEDNCEKAPCSLVEAEKTEDK